MTNTKETAPADELAVDINWQRAEEVLGHLCLTYQQQGYPYNLDTARLPQDERHMPESLPRGGVEHAMFLWTSCYYMRGSIKSAQAFRSLSKVYEHNAGLFEPAIAMTTPQPVIAAALAAEGLGLQDTVSEHWVENARRMQERWDGDPRKIFENVTDYATCLERVANDQKGGGFKGFREKMTSMILYYLVDAKLIENFDFPLQAHLK